MNARVRVPTNQPVVYKPNGFAVAKFGWIQARTRRRTAGRRETPPAPLPERPPARPPMVATAASPSHMNMRLFSPDFPRRQFLSMLAVFYPLVYWSDWVVFHFRILKTRVVSDLQPKTHRF